MNGSTIKGSYPRSEPIEISDSRIVDSVIFSDSYNKGIKLVKCIVIETDAPIGCCSANLDIQESTLVDSLIRATNNSNRLEINATKLIRTPVSLPSASSVKIDNSLIQAKKSKGPSKYSGTIDYPYALDVKNLTIHNTSLTGDGNITAIKIGYSSTLDAQNILIHNFAKGIQLSGGRDNSLNLTSSNMLEVSGYGFENLTNKAVLARNNFWGSTSADLISTKVWDYYDDLNRVIV